jgi:hypothetical protein
MSDFKCHRLTVPCPHPRRHSSLSASNPSANLTFGSSASALGQSSDLLICRPHACVRSLWRRYYRSCRAQPPISPDCPRLSGFMRSAFTDSRVSNPCPSRRGDSRSPPLSRSFCHFHLFVSLSALVALVGGNRFSSASANWRGHRPIAVPCTPMRPAKRPVQQVLHRSLS